jgi:hypothetical protein
MCKYTFILMILGFACSYYEESIFKQSGAWVAVDELLSLTHALYKKSL